MESESRHFSFSLWAKTSIGFTANEESTWLFANLVEENGRQAPQSSSSSSSQALSQQQTNDVLVPAFDSTVRRLQLKTAAASLTATLPLTMGVLVLPTAFEQCGVVMVTMLMLLVSTVTERALYLLCLSARHVGVISYGEVGWSSAGHGAEMFVAGILYVFLLCLLSVYMALLGTLSTIMVHTVLPSAKLRAVLLVVLGCLSPALVQRDVHSVRYVSYVGFVCTVMLSMIFGGGIIWKLVEAATNATATESSSAMEVEPMQENSSTIYWFPGGWDGILDGLLKGTPTILLCYVSSFNILPINSSLYQPTTGRVRQVIKDGITKAGFLLYLSGLVGYIWEVVTGKKLANALLTQQYIDFGLQSTGCNVVATVLSRLLAVGVVISSIVAVFQPCRSNILECIHRHIQKDECQICHQLHEVCPEACCEDDPTELETVPSFSSHQPSLNSTSQTTVPTSNLLYVICEGVELSQQSDGDDSDCTPESQVQKPCNLAANPRVRYLSTALICLLCYAMALILQGFVSETRISSFIAVFAVAGTVISYIIPAFCFIKINRRFPGSLDRHGWVKFSFFLLAFSGFGVGLCLTRVLVG